MSVPKPFRLLPAKGQYHGMMLNHMAQEELFREDSIPGILDPHLTVLRESVGRYQRGDLSSRALVESHFHQASMSFIDTDIKGARSLRFFGVERLAENPWGSIQEVWPEHPSGTEATAVRQDFEKRKFESTVIPQLSSKLVASAKLLLDGLETSFETPEVIEVIFPADGMEGWAGRGASTRMQEFLDLDGYLSTIQNEFGNKVLLFQKVGPVVVMRIGALRVYEAINRVYHGPKNALSFLPHDGVVQEDEIIFAYQGDQRIIGLSCFKEDGDFVEESSAAFSHHDVVHAIQGSRVFRDYRLMLAKVYSIFRQFFPDTKLPSETVMTVADLEFSPPMKASDHCFYAFAEFIDQLSYVEDMDKTRLSEFLGMCSRVVNRYIPQNEKKRYFDSIEMAKEWSPEDADDFYTDEF